MGINHTVITRTAAGVESTKVEVENGKPLARTLSMGDDWTSILIGVRFSLTGTTTLNPAPVIHCGVCSGITGIPTVSSVDHFFGLIGLSTGSSYFAYQAAYKEFWYHRASVGRVQGNVTNVDNTAYINCTESSDGLGVWFVKITKGVTWALRSWYHTDNTTGNITRADFDSIMSSGDPQGKTGVVSVHNHAMAINEGTYGPMDSVVFSFAGTTRVLEVSDFRVDRLA